MSTATIKSNARKLLTSFVSTLGVGSSWTSSALDICDYKTIVGICKTSSSNITVAYDQSATNSPWDVTSTQAITPGAGSPLNWTNMADYAQLRISAVNSTQGELIRLHIYGIPV